MNRTIMIFMFGAVFCVLHADPVLLLECEEKQDMRPARVGNENYITLVEGGRTGKCFRLVCPEKIGFHPWKQPMLKVDSPSDHIRIRLDVKGKGTLYLGFLSYDSQKKIFYPSHTGRTFELDHEDQWKRKEFVYVPKRGDLYSKHIGYILPYVEVRPGADVLVDNLSAEFMN